VATKQKDYLVTDASLYTMHPVHPVITEHRFQMIEEIKPQSKRSFFRAVALGAFIMFCAFLILGAVVGHH
jgi:hypothetical protein